MKAEAGHRAAPEPGGHPSFLSLEKALLGEVDAAERARLEARLAADPEWAARWREAAALRSRLTWQGLRARLPDGGAPPSGLRARFSERLDSILPRFPRPVLAVAAGLVLVILCLPFYGRNGRTAEGWRAKGSPRPEVALEADGTRVPAGRGFAVKPGTVLTFAYRSAQPLFVQIWYAEDGGAPRRFDGRKEENLYWSAHGDWSKAPQRVALEGAWKVQRVFIVASPTALGEADAAAWVAGRSLPRKDAYLFAYTLEQP